MENKAQHGQIAVLDVQHHKYSNMDFRGKLTSLINEGRCHRD